MGLFLCVRLAARRGLPGVLLFRQFPGAWSHWTKALPCIRYRRIAASPELTLTSCPVPRTIRGAWERRRHRRPPCPFGGVLAACPVVAAYFAGVSC